MHRRRRFIVAAVFLLSSITIAFAGRARADSVDLSNFPADSVWRCDGAGRVTSRKDPDGTVVWRWEIRGGVEAFCWLNESLPVHDQLGRFDRSVYDVNFAEGRINQFWPRAVGQQAPPLDKVLCEWNQFYFSHPHQTWLTYQQVLNHPNWYAFETAFAWPAKDVQLDRARLLGFACQPKTETCVIEFRNCRLVKDVIRVAPFYLTDPIGWPAFDASPPAGAGRVRYRTPYFVKNVSDKPVRVTATVASKHALFDVSVEPPDAPLQPGARRRFDVVARLRETAAQSTPMSEETAVVSFVPDGDASLAYRTETFCTTPLPTDARRMALYSPREVESLRANPTAAIAAADFWMHLKLEGETEIPHGVGHLLIAGIPAKCPACKVGTLHADEHWLEVKCDRCGHTERHTTAADATWIATWSAIHGAGDSPLSLGRAYLATGDEKFARQAIRLLRLLASGYAKLPWHNAYGPEGWAHEEPASPDARTIAASTRWGNSPSYGTNFMVQHLAELHDAIVDSPSWTPHDRAAVRDGLWVPLATELMKITPGISNMNDIINHDLVLAALATGDANLLYRGTLHPMGVVGRLSDISQDGFSDEGGALNYHLAAAREWFPTVAHLLNSRIALPGLTDRAAAAIRMPLLRASLNGWAYCTGNSGAAWFSVPLDAEIFKAADEFFPPAQQWQRERHYETAPTLFRDAGWAILRAGDTAASQVMVNLDFGRSHGHGDLDRMNLGLLAFGVPLGADPGSAYNFNTSAKSGPAESSMSGPFVANTVVVDASHQLRGAGTLLSWNPNPKLQRVSARITGVYPGVDWRRDVGLVDGAIVVIVDDLQSDKPHRFEQAWHHYGSAAPGDGCSFADLDAPLGEDSAYKDLLHPRRLKGEPPTMTWAVQGAHVRAWQLASEPPPSLTYTAQTGVCWGDTRGLPVDGLFTRRDATRGARFVTVLEPFNEKPLLKSATLTHDRNAPATTSTVKLVFNDGRARDVSFAAKDFP